MNALATPSLTRSGFLSEPAAVSLTMGDPRVKSPHQAEVWFLDGIDRLQKALVRTDDAVSTLYCAVLQIHLAALDHEILCGRKLDAKAVVTAAFHDPAINTGGWEWVDNRINRALSADSSFSLVDSHAA